MNLCILKVAFFQKVLFVFQISKSQKKISYPELEIQISRQYHFTGIGGIFKFQAQDSFLEFFSLRDLIKIHRTF